MNRTYGKSRFLSSRLQFVILLILLIIITVPVTAMDTYADKVTADGEILIFGGRVIDKAGNPLTDVSVEIWQTDEKGIYDHSGDSNTRQRDKGFQFFGTSVSDASGAYNFRTIVPGKYEPRPRHIHVKIRRSGRVLLVTQIYFAVDGETAGFGGSTRNLRMDLNTEKNADGSTYYTGNFDFVIDTGTAGDLRLTDRQGEGPYYPQADVSEYDNDLANVD